MARPLLRSRLPPRAIAACALAAILVVGFSASARAAGFSPAAFIRDASDPTTGELYTYPDAGHFYDPYDSNYGAMGLAVDFEQTKDVADINDAWAELHWYAQSASASPYDVAERSDGNPPVNQVPDSEDAYAATFLTATYLTYEAGIGSSSTASESKSELSNSLIVSAIVQAYNVIALGTGGCLNGTTWLDEAICIDSTGKIINKAMYLIDNAEVQDGLGAAAKLFALVGSAHSTQSTDAAFYADVVGDGIFASTSSTSDVGLWNASGGYLYQARATDGALQPTPAEFYPSGTDEAFAVGDATYLAKLVGLTPTITASQAATILLNFNGYGYWGQPDVAEGHVAGQTEPYYFPMAAVGYGYVGSLSSSNWLYTLAGDDGAACIYDYANAHLDPNSTPADLPQWPFTVEQAAQLVFAEAEGISTSATTCSNP